MNCHQLGLPLSLMLAACASVPSTHSEEERPEQVVSSFEEGCAHEDSLLLLCGDDTCGFFQCRDTLPGQIELARGGGTIAPPASPGGAPRRWWGPRGCGAAPYRCSPSAFTPRSTRSLCSRHRWRYRLDGTSATTSFRRRPTCSGGSYDRGWPFTTSRSLSRSTFTGAFTAADPEVACGTQLGGSFRPTTRERRPKRSTGMPGS
jgi:hypothetical protein